MNSIATLGMFTDIRGGGSRGATYGAIIKKEEAIKPKIRVHSLEIKNKAKEKDFITIKFVE